MRVRSPGEDGAAERHAFVRVSRADRSALVAGPVVRVAIRPVPGRVDTHGAEVFQTEKVARLDAWIDRDTASGVERLACVISGNRIERTAVTADRTAADPTQPSVDIHRSADSD